MTDRRSDVYVIAGELHALLSAAGTVPPVVLDARWALGQDDWREQYLAGHIAGAAFVDFEKDLAEHGLPATEGRHPLPNIDRLQSAARRWGINQDSEVVVYDQTGGLSAGRAWWVLRWAGVSKVRILNGGLPAWVRAGFDLEAGEPSWSTVGNVELSAANLPTLDTDGAQEQAQSQHAVLLDARGFTRYAGEEEPVDPVAGHIPGALSFPVAETLSEDGTVVAAEAIRAQLAERGVTADSSVGIYCGSGVTASQLVAALASVGVDATLYPGSWSQWSNDPSRPVATGPEPG